MSERAKTILAWVIIILVGIVAVVCGCGALGQPAPSPSPTPFTITDENVRQIPLEQILATLKHARQLAADAIERADKQASTLAAALASSTEVMNAAKEALVKLDAHDKQVADLAAENEKNKEESLRKDTVIAKKDATIFKLGATCAGLLLLIAAYVALRLFTNFPI